MATFDHEHITKAAAVGVARGVDAQRIRAVFALKRSQHHVEEAQVAVRFVAALVLPASPLPLEVE